MKLLMIFADNFGYQTNLKTLEELPDISVSHAIKKALVGFIQAEAEDQERQGYITTKLLKNLKWAARKNETETIVLHSFAHLSESKAESEFTKAIFDETQARLEKSGYQVSQTPFGYFLNLDLQAPGFPLARLFKSF